MDENTLKAIAQQLRKPQGEHAVQIGEKMNEGNLHINLNTIEALRLKPADSVLEIGMGNGFFVKDILSRGDSIKYTGCDFSKEMIDEASNRNKKFVLSGKANFYLASVDHLPFDDHAFDIVFTINTIYFWENAPLALAEIRRVLKPAGKVFIAVRPKSVMQHYPFVKYGFKRVQ